MNVLVAAIKRVVLSNLLTPDVVLCCDVMSCDVMCCAVLSCPVLSCPALLSCAPCYSQRTTTTCELASWFLVLELLPQPSNGQGEEEEAPTNDCNTRRVILWLCGIVCVSLEIVGFVYSYVAPETTVLGFTISTFVSFFTVLIGSMVIFAWAISGLSFISRMQKVVDAAPRVRGLITLFNAHLIILVVVYVVYAILVVLYPLFLAFNPYAYTVTISLHRLCEFFITFSLLRIIDGNGSGYVGLAVEASSLHDCHALTGISPFLSLLLSSVYAPAPFCQGIARPYCVDTNDPCRDPS